MSNIALPPRVPLPLTVPDAVCWDDVDALGRETTSDLESLEQDCYHILLEDLGSNPDDVGRGVGIFQLLSGTAANIPTACRAIEEQYLRDDRIDTCVASITLEEDEYIIRVNVGVDGTVVGLVYSYSQANGLRVVTPPGGP